MSEKTTVKCKDDCKEKQAGAELCQAQLQLKLQSKLAVVIKVGVQLLFLVRGVGWMGGGRVEIN